MELQLDYITPCFVNTKETGYNSKPFKYFYTIYLATSNELKKKPTQILAIL